MSASLAAQSARATRLQTAVQFAAQARYKEALEEYERLAAQETSPLARQRLMCLLYLDRSADGLTLLDSLPRSALSARERYLIELVLAVDAGDDLRWREVVLRQATAGQSHVNANSNLAGYLMKAALEFGRLYQPGAMHILAHKAFLEGNVDADLRADYGQSCVTNGDLRRGLSELQAAAEMTSDTEKRKGIESLIYNTKNIIYQFTRNISIEEEEARRHREFASKYAKDFWN